VPGAATRHVARIDLPDLAPGAYTVRVRYLGNAQVVEKGARAMDLIVK
jgi:hypothetical protein